MDAFIAILEGIIIIFVTGYLFYGYIWAFIPLTPYLYFHCKNKAQQLKLRKHENRMYQFRDGMAALNSALAVGYSIENSFRKSLLELTRLHGKNSDIVKGFEKIVNKLALNENVEKAIVQFAIDIEVEDAIYFAEVFRYLKRSGGDMTVTIRKTTKNITEKINVKKEINTLIAGRKMEQKVMNLIPYGIIAYIRLTAPEFLLPMYGNITGIIIMSVCLVVYIAAIKWSEKIMKIEV